jgi:HAMP domain-containing protein
MATIQVDSLILKAQTIIQDTTKTFSAGMDDGIRWTKQEWLAWLNDGQRETVLYRPSANIRSLTHNFDNGTLQKIPTTDGVMFVDLPRNTSSGGVATSVIRATDRAALDATRPDWHADASTGVVKYFIYDPRNPKEFFVYPQATTSMYAHLVYSATPADCSLGGVISIDDIYANALVDYMLYRAYSKDSTFAGNAQLAVAHYTAFQTSLAARTANEGK